MFESFAEKQCGKYKITCSQNQKCENGKCVPISKEGFQLLGGTGIGKKGIESFVNEAQTVPTRPLAGRYDIPMGPPYEPENLNPAQISQNSDAIIERVNAAEAKFNAALRQYTTAYQTLSQEILSNSQNSILQQYGNQVVENQGVKYYVNPYGFARRYTDEAWAARPTTGAGKCAGTPIAIEDAQFQQLLGGDPMGVGEPCGVAGSNVSHGNGNGPVAFVGISGKKSVFDNSVYNALSNPPLDNRNESCQMTPLTLTESQFNAIPSGSNISSPTTYCSRFNVSNSILDQLTKSRADMMAAADELEQAVQDDEGAINQLGDQLVQIRMDIHNKLQAVNNLTDDFGAQRIKMGQSDVASTLSNLDLNRTIEATTRDTEIILRMNYLKYLVGLIIVVLLVIFSFYNFSSDRQSGISIIILLLVIIAVLYNFWNFISRKFF